MKRFFRVTALWILILPSLPTTLGFLSNQAVLIANHQTFPVLVNSRRDDIDYDGYFKHDNTHVVMTSKTHLNALADIFDLKSDGTVSIGDMLLDLGDWLKTFCPYIWAAFVSRKLYLLAR